jgi:chromosome segregation ATPase
MSLTLNMIEFILLLFGAIIVGITIHSIFSGRGRRMQKALALGNLPEKDEWKSKYLTDTVARNKEISALQQQLHESEQTASALTRQAEELRQHNTKIESVIEQLEKKIADMEKESIGKVSQLIPVMGTLNKADYLDQVLFAQSNLMEQNEKINQALNSLQMLKEREEKQRQILRDNEQLAAEINKVKSELVNKEKEISTMKQKEHLTREMASMLDAAYGELNTLQQTIRQLEVKLTDSKLSSVEYEDIKDEYSRLSADMENYRGKASALAVENQVLQQELTAMRDKSKESDFHRQQLQKRIIYLGELNAELQKVADANKKLESQMKQIGKIENMLNTIAEERDGFTHRHHKNG